MFIPHDGMENDRGKEIRDDFSEKPVRIVYGMITELHICASKHLYCQLHFLCCVLYSFSKRFRQRTRCLLLNECVCVFLCSDDCIKHLIAVQYYTIL